MDPQSLDVPISGLPPELEGFRILHLSDLHLGTLSLNGRALDRALEWAQGERPDLVAITGDLVTRRGGKAKLEEALGRLAGRYGTFAVLGNHDVDDARDPFSRPTDVSDLHERGATLLRGTARTLDVNGRRIQVVGAEPDRELADTTQLEDLVEEGSDLRILLCHFPDIVDRLRPGAYHLVLAGHLHGGQICIPGPRGKLRLSHVRGRYWEGLFVTPGGVLHVSRGVGTTFVPFRLLARPDATVLTLERRD
ncbi:MAG: metallophosphoesterase [Actinomycetota bacterium]|nr:metallophosphoesterase [Actinomycetota bacterium]